MIEFSLQKSQPQQILLAQLIELRFTALGVAAAAHARRILDEFEAADETFDAACAGRSGTFRVTAVPMWIDTVLPQAMARFHAERPGIRLILDTATRAEGLRRLAGGHSDLHCGGIDGGELLPASLRRERFVDMTAGIVAWHDHPLLERGASDDDPAGCPWIDYDAPVRLPPEDPRPSLAALLEQLHRSTRTRVRTVVDAGNAACCSWPAVRISRALAHLHRTPPRGLPAAPAARVRALPLPLPLGVRRQALDRGPAAVPPLRGDPARHLARPAGLSLGPRLDHAALAHATPDRRLRPGSRPSSRAAHAIPRRPDHAGALRRGRMPHRPLHGVRHRGTLMQTRIRRGCTIALQGDVA